MWNWLKRLFGRAQVRARDAGETIAATPRFIFNRLTDPKIKLSYFHEALAIELQAINDRRAKLARKKGRSEPLEKVTQLEPRVEQLPGHPPRPKSAKLPEPRVRPETSVNPNRPDPARMRPRPIPCTTVGLALSGGGIRSAAFSLGALQALDYHQVLPRVDYLSTVSGGGYMGASMTAGMSEGRGEFPFGGGSDVRDNDAIGHIRNYSNYLMPRARSGLRNVLDASAILLRGLLANGIFVFSFLLVGALITYAGYPTWSELPYGNFIPRVLVGLVNVIASAFAAILPSDPSGWPGYITSLLGQATAFIGGWLVWFIDVVLAGAAKGVYAVASWFGVRDVLDVFVSLFTSRFGFTALLAILLATTLVKWALRRSVTEADENDVDEDDVNSRSLRTARWLLASTVLSAVLDLQPLLIYGLAFLYKSWTFALPAVVSPALVTGAVIVALFSRRLAAFLETTELTARGFVRVRRAVTQGLFIMTGLVLPLTLVIVYWHLSAWVIAGDDVWKPFDEATTRRLYGLAILVFIPIVFTFKANAYSLHQLYKDRLSKAFLFKPKFTGRSDPDPLMNFKLSHIKTDDCPYHIINTALNVQGSKEANRRGRNADFFTFTPDFIGSDLTHFAPTARVNTTDMEKVDPRLDLGSAMAISGAALSANMGSNTLRWLSPTLALLNIRLGYWLRNPRDLAKRRRLIRPGEWLFNFLGKFYLLLEMFNVLDEERRFIYLSDGGHIENLGIYQLLKRGCRLIIAIDAEADPALSCGSLLKLERYARIDLGVRIILPWEQIATRNRETNLAVASPCPLVRQRGPHSAVGRVLYEDGSYGVLLYFKSSLSGDEKDYVIDYKKRNRDFPHETTGDQFFTEEQFECYRALGYHVVEGFFSNSDDCSVLTGGHGAWAGDIEARNEIREALRMSLLRQQAPAGSVVPPPPQNEEVRQTIAAQ